MGLVCAFVKEDDYRGCGGNLKTFDTFVRSCEEQKKSWRNVQKMEENVYILCVILLEDG